MKSYKLKDVAKIYNGATPLTKNKNYYKEGDISWITPKDLSGYEHKYIYSGQRNITEAGLQSCATTMLPKGTVLLSSRAPIGYVAIAGQELCTNQGFKSFICNEKYIDHQYLYYYFKTYTDKLKALGNGSTFKEITRKAISEYQIELPSVDEQRNAIKELVLLDERYDKNCELLSKLETLFEYIYCITFECCEGALKQVTIGSVVEILTGGTPSTNNDEYWNNGIYDWYTPSDVTSNSTMITYGANNKISVMGLVNSNAKLIPAKSVLMTSRATIGEATINMVEATTNQGMFALIPKKESITTLQLYFWVKRNKKKIASIANGSTFKEVYKKDFEKLSIFVSNEASAVFHKKTYTLFKLYDSLVKENKVIAELKQHIMNIKF